MRIYNDAVEMIKEVERDLYEMGTRYQSSTFQDRNVERNKDFETIELTGYCYTLTNFDTIKLSEMVSYTGFSERRKQWVAAEIKERIFGTDKNPGMAWEIDYEFWSQFLRNDFFSYSYAERWQEQLPYVIRELERNKNTRQAIMTMYDRHQDMMNWGGLDRVPCSISYQFLIREEKLVLIYNQRSCDFVNFFPADVFMTIRLLEYVAGRLNIEAAHFIHFIGSLHVFAKDFKEGIF